METALEFMKLEKIELGGIKGKVLSQQVIQLFDEFNEQYKVFTERSYDCLDTASNVSNLLCFVSSMHTIYSHFK